MGNRTEIVLDATMIDTFMLCACKFNYRFNRNLVTPTKAKPSDRGSLVHVGMENYFKTLNNGWVKACEAGIESVQLSSVEDCDLDPSEVKRVIDVLVETWDVFKTMDERMEILGVEQPFAYELFIDENIRIIMIGKIDLIVNQPGYVSLPYDHKSYERDTPVYRKTNQFQNYVYATGSNYLMVNRIGFQTSIKPEVKHKRIPLSYDPLLLEQWKGNIVKWAYQYLECAMTDSWPMNDTSCDKYNRPCEYYEVCDASGLPAKEHKLVTNFNIGPKWDVSKSLSRKL